MGGFQDPDSDGLEDREQVSHFVVAEKHISVIGEYQILEYSENTLSDPTSVAPYK